MISPVLIALAWKSVVCAGLTLAALRLFRSRSAAERSRLGHAGLLATLLIPVASLALPAVEVSAPESLAPLVEAAAPLAAPAESTRAAAPTPPVFAGPEPAIDPQLVQGMLVAIPAMLLLGLTLVAVVRLQRLRARARMLVDSRWLTALATIQQRFGFRHGTALLVSEELASPISWGVLRPVILLDPRAAADSGQAEAIVAHELAHVAGLDWAKLLIGRMACALLWFNPLVWMLARSCHDLREEAADDAVLRTDLASEDYAELLVGAARRENRAMWLAANGVAPTRTSLSRRVVRVLDPSCSRAQAGLAWTLACSMAVTVVSAWLAVITFAGPAGEAAAVTGARNANSPARPPARERNGSESVFPEPPAAAPAAAAVFEATDLPAARPAGRADPGSPLLIEALIDSARRGDTSALAQWLALGVSPDAASPGEGTALIAAVESGRTDVVRFLLARGANVDLAVRGDGSPLIVASRSGQRALVELLLDEGAAINAAVPDDGSPLTAAAAAGQADVVALLLDRGASLEQIVPGEENALISASDNGHEDVVRLLLRRGANVNSRAFGRTALKMAQAGGHGRIESLLRKAGATR